MTDLNADEQRYLMQAFDASPVDWFRPTGVGEQHFSDPQIQRIVAALVAGGLMIGQPDCHARLTDLGRKRAARLSKPQHRGYFRIRHKVWLAVVTTSGAAVILLLLFRWSGVLQEY